MYEQLPVEYDRDTRLTSSNSLRIALTRRVTLKLAEKSFMHRAVNYYNQIPVEFSKLQNILTFKKNLKIWVQNNLRIINGQGRKMDKSS